MYNITLVATRHENFGNCNSDELYRILENLNPEVIFEEIPPILFDRYYLDKSRSNLETDAIHKYIQNRKISQVPVDSNDLPSEEFFKNHQYMLQRIEGLADQNGFTYRNLIDINKLKIGQYGFKYLNSTHYTNVIDEINSAIESGLQKINNDKLFQAFKSWVDVNENRENQMLQNIYRYSQDSKYDESVFLIGAAHRKAIIEKISKYQKNQKVHLNWIFNNCY